MSENDNCHCAGTTEYYCNGADDFLTRCNVKKSLQGRGMSKQFATITGWSKDKSLMSS